MVAQYRHMGIAVIVLLLFILSGIGILWGVNREDKRLAEEEARWVEQGYPIK